MNNLFIEHLTVIDFSYFQPHRGVVGESWIVDIELIGAFIFVLLVIYTNICTLVLFEKENSSSTFSTLINKD